MRIHPWARIAVPLVFAGAALLPPAGGYAQDGDPQPLEILEYRIVGNTTLPTLTIEKAVYPFLGPGRSTEDVDRARASLEQAYHGAGYLTVVVEVPPQQVRDGVVTLRVSEAKVSKLQVRDAKYNLPSRIKQAVPALAQDTVPHFPSAQDQLTALSRSPDLQVTPVLRAGRAPGSIEVDLKVKDKLPLHGSVELNNKQSPDTSRGRFEAGLRYDNLWQRRHSVALYYFVAPRDPDQVEVITGSYALPLGGDGSLLALYYAHSNSDVPTAFDSGVIGKGDSIGARASLPLPGRGAWFHSLSLGADYIDSAQTTQLVGGLAVLDQPVRYTALAAQYDAVYPGRTGEWRLGASTRMGVSALNERNIDCNGVTLDQFTCRRDGAQPNFFLLRGEAQRVQTLPKDWSALLRLDFQLAAQPQINNEQIVAGGFETVRGYLEAEAAGDDGVRARLELRTPPRKLLEPTTVQGFAFFDWAQLWLQDLPPDTTDRFRLGSVGLGLRAEAWRTLTAALDLAFTLSDGPYTPAGSQRLDVRVGYAF
jgi:hemolysin activation/secretion protein